jgi:hypothetical protein
MTKELFLRIQGMLWDSAPSYPSELTREVWLEYCEVFYDKNEALLTEPTY